MDNNEEEHSNITEAEKAVEMGDDSLFEDQDLAISVQQENFSLASLKYDSGELSDMDRLQQLDEQLDAYNSSARSAKRMKASGSKEELSGNNINFILNATPNKGGGSGA